MTSEKQTVGILGLGFLGKLLAGIQNWKDGSWGSWHSSPVDLTGLHQFRYNWQDPADWPLIPSGPVVLVLTIPPPRIELEALKQLMSDWSIWMRNERPRIQRLVFISTIGVYPRQAGTWREDSVFEPDTESGRRRLLTEQMLSRNFQLQVVRPGGIYGPGRNLLERLRAGRNIPDTGTPTHRIHVRDLARIVCHCIRNSEVTLLNAVDHEPCPSRDVVRWLLEHHPDAADLTSGLPELSRPEQPPIPRYISNRLMSELGIRLEYPSYREGIL